MSPGAQAQRTPPRHEWSYGDEGGAYPVADGDVWRVGAHILVCSDLMATGQYDAVVDQLRATDRPIVVSPTVLYADPPWGQALANGYRTKANLPRATYRFEQLYRRVADIGHRLRLPVWLEGSTVDKPMGRAVPGAIRPTSATYGTRPGQPLRPLPTHPCYWQISYGGHPAGLYYDGPCPPPPGLAPRTGELAGDPDPLTGVDDERTPRVVLRAYDLMDPHAVHTVLDPCAGRGWTARAALAVGWSSITNELNPRRLSAALARLTADYAQRAATQRLPASAAPTPERIAPIR